MSTITVDTTIDGVIIVRGPGWSLGCVSIPRLTLAESLSRELKLAEATANLMQTRADRLAEALHLVETDPLNTVIEPPK